MNEFDNFLFKNTVVPRNRKEIRAMMQDRKRFEPLLKKAGDIIEKALTEIKESESIEEMMKIYKYYHNPFNSVCDVIEHGYRPKYWKLNRKFYTETVKPVI